jgi:hypothetical protein
VVFHPLGVLLLLGAPVVPVFRLASPRPTGVSLGVWLGWQLAPLAAMALGAAAALFRGAPAREARPTLIWLGMALALGTAAVGLFAWQPGSRGWDSWYTFLWLPGLLLVARPAARGATITGIAAVAGSAAALLTWGAMTESRLEAAQQDAMRLGRAVDPVMVPLPSGPVPGSARSRRRMTRHSSTQAGGRRGPDSRVTRLA